ncbi:MAG: BfmA/BtgA family mobilization protein [Bacteroidales bacterium]
MAKKDTITTVSIDSETGAKLERLAKSNNLSKKALLSLMLDYFEKYGINPAEHESPAQEMQKLIKRVDQIVGFIKVQEKELIRPLVASVSMTEERIKSDLDNIAKKEKLQEFIDAVSKNTAVQQEQKRKLMEAINQVEAENKKRTDKTLQALRVLAEHLDDKGKAGLIGKLFG